MQTRHRICLKVQPARETRAGIFQEQLEIRTVPETDDQANSMPGKRILLVDDEPSNIFAMKRVLKRWAVDIVTAGSGDEAISRLHEMPNGIDLILMDIMMPGKDGYETMREIRADARYRSLPIIALTAKAMRGDRELCLEAGATEYLSKPVDMVQLKETITRLL